MNLKELLKGLDWNGEVNKEAPNEVSSITTDSRNSVKNSLFIAIRGVAVDGHSYILDAIKHGARVIVHEKSTVKPKHYPQILFIKVGDSRKASAIIAANYHGNVHKRMKLFSITGTNGKTTTSELTYQLLKKLKKKVGLISTVSAKFSGSELDTGYHVTTPDSIELHKIIATMYKKGCEHLIIETTSHGLDQHRTWGLNFEVGAVTNVTPEHLDYHKTFTKYLNAKARLFDQSNVTLLNKFDPALYKLVKRLPTHAKYEIVDYTKLKFPKAFVNKFPGQYNLENAAMAHAIVEKIAGVSTARYFGSLQSVRGRMEVIKTKTNITIVIDFAHDATALENVLKVAKTLTENKLILVFGCAGLRDTAKRPKMGGLAVKLADQAVLTAEDPRTEKLANINKEIVGGITAVGGKINRDYFVIDDRQEAINFAINKLAKDGDLVLITGKGHEKSMCFGTTEYPWSDQQAVKNALALQSSYNNIPISQVISPPIITVD